MMKRVSLLLTLGALALCSTQALADAVIWRTVTPLMTTRLAAWPFNGGVVDSAQVSWGAAATIDTSESFTLPDQYINADSLTIIHVSVIGSQAFASGESAYVSLEGSADGKVWTNTSIASCGTCRAGGFAGAMTVVPGTSASSGSVKLNGKGSSTGGGVASGSGVIGLNNIYAGFWNWPYLRVKILQTIATANVAQYYHVLVTYQAVDRPRTP